MLIYKGLHVLAGAKPFLPVLACFGFRHMHSAVFTANHVFGFNGRLVLAGYSLSIKMT